MRTSNTTNKFCNPFEMQTNQCTAFTKCYCFEVAGTKIKYLFQFLGQLCFILY